MGRASGGRETERRLGPPGAWSALDVSEHSDAEYAFVNHDGSGSLAEAFRTIANGLVAVRRTH